MGYQPRANWPCDDKHDKQTGYTRGSKSDSVTHAGFELNKSGLSLLVNITTFLAQLLRPLSPSLA